MKTTLIVLMLLLVISLWGEEAVIYSTEMFTVDSLISVDYDTTKVLLFKPINIELMVPVHHREEAYYPVGQDYSGFNIIIYEIGYMVKEYKNYLYQHSYPTNKYYDLNWKEIDYEPLFLVDWKYYLPDTLRF